MPVTRIQGILKKLEERLGALKSSGKLSEADAQRIETALASVRQAVRPVSPEEADQTRIWLEQQGGYPAVFGVGGSFWRGLFRFLGTDPTGRKQIVDPDWKLLEDYFKGGRSLEALISAFGFGLFYHEWDIEARKLWKQSLEELLRSAMAGESGALRRLAVIHPSLVVGVPTTVILFLAKLLDRDGDFFIKFGKALKGGVADRRQRRAVGELDNWLLFGAALLKEGPWSDADLLSAFQAEGIAPTMDVSTFKIRRQRLAGC